MFIKDEIMDEAQDAIIQAREFCADEKAAVREVLAQFRITVKTDRDRVWRVAKGRANKQWNGFRADAGVTRISRPQDWKALM